MKNTLRNLLSRPSLQPFLVSLLKLSHAGLNYGGGQCVSDSGEMGVLRLVLQSFKEESKLVLFDVGANNGDYLEAALGVFGSPLKAFAFEPQSACLDLLRSRYGINPNISIHNFAMSDREGVADLFFAEERDSVASLSRQNASQTNTRDVPLTTVDQFCKQNGIDRIHLLKIDTEGHEMEVLRGASEMIQEERIDFIQFEFGDTFLHTPYHFIDLWSYLSDRYEIHRILRHGLARLDRYSHDLEIYKNANFLSIRKPG